MTKLVALHHQVYVTLRNQLLGGAYQHEDGAPRALPSEVELARQFGVSRVTIRRSLDTLEKDKLIVRRHGAGTFPVVPSQPARPHGGLTGFYTEVKSRAFGYDKKVLAYGRTSTPPDILRDTPSFGETCLHLAVVSLRDGQPIHVNRQYVCDPFAAMFDAKLGDTASLLLVLRDMGVISQAIDLTITAVEADLDATDLLDVRVGAPLLQTRRISRDAEGTAFEYLYALTRPDLYSYNFRFGELPGEAPPAPADQFETMPASGPRRSPRWSNLRRRRG